MEQPWAAAIAAIATILAAGLAGWWARKSKSIEVEASTESTLIASLMHERETMNAQMSVLWKRIDDLEASESEWRTKHQVVLLENTNLKHAVADLKATNTRLMVELRVLQQRVTALEQQQGDR